MNLQGKVALVTGGGKGLGKVIALRLAKAGADLVLTARTKEPLEEVAQAVKQLGRRAVIVVGDASQEEAAEATVNQAIAEWGKIDILVNNAGIEGANAFLEDISLADWNEAVGVNMTSVFLFCKKVIPHMKRRGSGSIINISSLNGVKGLRCRSPYCATKWAMVGITRTLAEELGSYNIRANTVCPGAVKGERIDRVMLKRAENFGITYDEMIKKTNETTPLGRFVEPEEVAATVLFLASDEASGITGEEILVTCGRR